MLAVAYVTLRIVYIAMYIAGLGSARSAVWALAFLVNIAILFAGALDGLRAYVKTRTGCSRCRRRGAPLSSIRIHKNEEACGRHFMLNRRTFTAAAALGAAAIAAPLVHAQAKLEKSKVSIAVGGKAAFYYLPLTISEQLGYFKAEGLDVEISDFAGGARALQARGGRLGRRRARAPTSTPSTCRPRTSTSRPSCCRAARRRSRSACRPRTCPTTRRVADLKGKKIGVSAPGSSTNMVANLVLSRGGLKASDVSFIGVGVGGRRADGAALGPDRRHQQHRPGDDHARAEGRREDHQRHAHAQGHAGGVRRPDAGRLPLRAGRVHPEESQHLPGAGQCHRARPEVAADGRARATSSRPCPRPTCWATARCTSLRSTRCARRSPPTA